MAMGDHLTITWNSVTHEGIDIGDGTVVHVLGKKLSDGNRIARQPKNVFANGREIEVQHHYSSSYYGSTRDAEDIAAKALEVVNDPYAYNFLWKNCEHFVDSCIYEHGPDTDQVRAEVNQITRHYAALRNFGRRIRFRGGAFLGFEIGRHLLMSHINNLRNCVDTSLYYVASEYHDRDDNVYIFTDVNNVEYHDYAFSRRGWYSVTDYGVEHLSKDPGIPFVSHHDYLFDEDANQYYNGTSTDYTPSRLYHD